jgi:F-type H+-transporting ATPase subunit gamma
MNIRSLRKRIGSIKNIGKVANALSLVSAARVQKIEDMAVESKLYAKEVFNLTKNVWNVALLADLGWGRKKDMGGGSLFVLISTDRGLVGSLNASLFRKLDEFLSTKNLSKRFFVVVGKKGRSYAMDRGDLVADFSDYSPYISASIPIVKLIVNGFMSGEYKDCYLVFNDFVNIVVQKPKIKKILPLASYAEQKGLFGEPFEVIGEEENAPPVNGKEKFNCSFEPSEEKVVNTLISFYLEIQVSQAIVEARASEYAARMVSMRSASDNANQLGKTLMLDYNKGRQEIITNEISDITTASSLLV